MESNIKTIVLDFYGVPGSGKTTESHIMADYLRSKNKKVKEPSYYLDHIVPLWRRKIMKLKMAVWTRLFRSKQYKEIVALVIENGYNRTNGQTSQIINITTKLFALNRFVGLVDYLIFDEGLAQAAISLSVNSNISAGENLKQLISIIGNTLQIRLIKTELSIEEALRRIESRSSKDTRVEAMKTKQKKIELMKRYEFASNQISNMKPIKEIGIYEPFGE
jgi:thymidylate kinase